MTPQISCIVSAYNASRYLREAIDSMLAQTFGDFELICVDDGSTDDTGAILDEYARKDPRVKVIHQKNAGQAKAAMLGIAQARGTYLARMDADDIASPTRFAKQVEFLNAHPEVVLLGGAYELIDEDGRLLTTLVQATDNPTLQQICLGGSCPICQPLAMFRREAYDKVGGYRDVIPAEDLDLWLRLGEVGEIRCLPDVLLKYRQHSKSVSESRQREQIEMMEKVCREAWARRGLDAMPLQPRTGWRSDGSRPSLYRQHLKYGWWAFNSANHAGARHYALRAIRMFPLKLDGYKLLYASFKPRKVRAG